MGIFLSFSLFFSLFSLFFYSKWARGGRGGAWGVWESHFHRFEVDLDVFFKKSNIFHLKCVFYVKNVFFMKGQGLVGPPLGPWAPLPGRGPMGPPWPWPWPWPWPLAMASRRRFSTVFLDPEAVSTGTSTVLDGAARATL